MKKILFIGLLIFSLAGAKAQEIRLLKGKITDSIRVFSDSADETYALYLPVQFDMAKKWPVIFVFDPAGRGKLAVEHFVEAADRYGYIIAASNNVKNGTYQENFRFASGLFESVSSMFPVNPDLLYTAGFSGGARIASTIAVISDKVKGVIACGASYSADPQYIPKNRLFLFVGIVGESDFNFLEMIEAQKYLNSKKFDTDFLVFDGGHQWPPSSFITKAVRLFSLKSMTRELTPLNLQLAEQYFREDKKFNDSLRKAQKLIWVYDDLEEIMENYRFYRQNDSLKKELKTLKKDKGFMPKYNELIRAIRAEQMYKEDYMVFLPQDISAGDPEALGFWDQEIKKLNDLATNNKEADKNMVHRVKGYLGVVAKELQGNLKPENTDQHLFVSIFNTILDPADQDAYLNVIQYACQKGNYDMALYYTEQLLATGFTDVKKIREIEGTALLRISPEYNDLLREHNLETRY